MRSDRPQRPFWQQLWPAPLFAIRFASALRVSFAPRGGRSCIHTVSDVFKKCINRKPAQRSCGPGVCVSSTQRNLSFLFGIVILRFLRVFSITMYDYRRLSNDSLYENPLNSVFRTPTEKEIIRLEDSNKELIEKWRQYKNELEDEIVEFRNEVSCDFLLKLKNTKIFRK